MESSKQNLASSNFSVSTTESYPRVKDSNPRSLSNRKYVYMLFFCFLIVVGLITALVIVATQKSESKDQTVQTTTPSSAPGVCKSKDCVNAASFIIKSIDETVDPCDDFYEYACGNWVKSRVLSEDTSITGSFYELIDQVNIKVKALLEKPIVPEDWEAVVKAKDYYKSCMNLTSIEDGNLTHVIELLKDLGGWPVISSTWTPSSFNIEDFYIKLRQFGGTPIFSFFADADSKDPKKRILHIDQTGLGMPDREYFLKGRDDPILLAYENYATQMAIMLGADDQVAKDDIKDMIDFEIRLANITIPKSQRRDATAMYNLMNIQNITDLYSFINFTKYITEVMNKANSGITIDASEPVINFSPSYFEQLTDIISSTTSRTINNYVLWRIVQGKTNALPKSFRDLQQKYVEALYGSSQATPRWKTCLSSTNVYVFPLAVGALFVEEHFQKEAKTDVLEMITQLTKSMKQIINDNDWMDATTKNRAKEKADAMKSKIGFPDKLLNEGELNREYEDIHVQDNTYFNNTVNIGSASALYYLKKLRDPVDPSKWQMPAAMVNAYYSSKNNEIVFPAGILQPPFYRKDYPDYLNYGGIGFVIGHEITHGFDDSGRQFDKDGKLQQWWTDSSVNNFVSKTQCMINQYGNYTVKEANMNLNGKLTLGENIADNGGLKESFKAYRRLVAEKYGNTEEPFLPGLTLTPNQLFFINAAQVWCNIVRPGYAVRLVLVDYHSDGRSRVVGPLQNSNDFAEAYNCPVGSKMNPVKKCEIW